MAEKTWHGRTATSLLALAGFLVMGITGLILYLAPHGRVAYWTEWRLLGISKTSWTNIHVISSLLFVVAGSFHLYFNWKPLINYLSGKVAGVLKYKRELALTCVVTIWVVASGIWGLPPLSYINDLGEAIKGSWVIAPEYEPPFGHAELLTLKGFCRKMDIPLDKALAELKAKGVKVSGPDQTLEQIARANNTTAMHLYVHIKKFEPALPKADSSAGYTADSIEQMFAGKGVGRLKFKHLVKELNLNPTAVRKRLAAKGLEIDDEQSIKDVATKYNLNPLDVAKIMLIGK